MSQKLPKDGSISRNDMKILMKDQIFETLNSKDQRLVNCKFAEDLLKQIHGVKVDIAKIRVQGINDGIQKNNSMSMPGNRASFTAGQVLLQENKKIPR